MDPARVLPDGAVGTPLYNMRHPLLAPRFKPEEDASPKSVIADMRFISPASSSSSSMDRRPLPDTNHVKWQPRHDRGYSISDGDYSDPDTLLESSRELPKVGNSGLLESLPETHSLALKATRSGLSAGDVSFNAVPGNKLWGASESNSQCRLHSSVIADYEPILTTSKRRTVCNAIPNGRPLQLAATPPTIEDKHQIQQQKCSPHAATTNDDAPERDIQETFMSSSNHHTWSGSSWLSYQSRFSPDTLFLNRDEENRGSALRGPQAGSMHALDNAGTLQRFFPGSQSQLGSPVGSHLSFGSPGAEKGLGSYSPASLADHMSRGMGLQHRFLSGPLLGGMSPRPPPSKWDDAEKWIPSPSRHESAQPQQRPVQAPPGRRHSIGGHSQRPGFVVCSSDFSIPDVKPLSPNLEYTSTSFTRGESLQRSASQKKRAKTLSFGDLSKRVFDLSCSYEQPESGLLRDDENEEERDESTRTAIHLSSDGAEYGRANELYRTEESECHASSTQQRETKRSEVLDYDNSKTPAGTAGYLDNSMDVEILKHALTDSMKEISTNHQQPSYIPDVLSPSGQRWYFGRPKNPTESQKNSASTTPSFTASPTRHNTPARSGRRPASFGSFAGAGVLELQTWHLAKLEIYKPAGDDSNIAWSTREEEDIECSVSLREHDSGLLEKGVVDERDTVWEEAEQTEDNERPNKEETRIKAWEELQKSKAEEELLNIEIRIAKIRARALEKKKKRIAVMTKKAEEMRAAAQARKAGEAARTPQQVDQTADHISSFMKSPFRCCFATKSTTL